MVIDTNVSALFAENALSQTTNRMQALQQQLSTGQQINSPADNPAGLAIANLMSGELGGISSAIGNANQANNLLQTANGGMQNDVQIVQQIQQLAVQAANGTQTTQDQKDIQSQINNLLNQVNSNGQSINYNGLTLLNGSFGSTVSFSVASTSAFTNVLAGPDGGNAATGAYTVAISYSSSSSVYKVNILNSAGATVATGSVTVASNAGDVSVQLVAGTSGVTTSSSFVVDFNAASAATTATSSAAFTVASGTQLSFQVGPENGSQNTINANLGAFTTKSLGLNNINVVGGSNAQYAITLAQNALSMLTNAQGAVGSQMDQLNYTISNLQTESSNLQASKSTIMDANMANVTAKFAQQQVLQQTGLQALATAEQLPQSVLKLLG